MKHDNLALKSGENHPAPGAPGLLQTDDAGNFKSGPVKAPVIMSGPLTTLDIGFPWGRDPAKKSAQTAGESE